MITDIPKPEFFLDRCIDYHILALESLYNILEDTEILDLNNLIIELEDPEAELWDELDIRIGNVILLIFNSIENYLKYKVAAISPYLLIETPVKDWNWAAESKPFHKFFMHQFDSLLKIYAVTYVRPTEHIRTVFEQLRVARNMYVHGSTQHKTNPKKVLEISFKFLTEIWVQVDENGQSQSFFSYLIQRFDLSCLGLYYDVDRDYPNDDHLKLLTFYNFYDIAVGKRKALRLIGLEYEQPRVNCIFCDFNNNSQIIRNTYFATEEIEDEDTMIHCHLCQNSINKDDLPAN